MIGWRSVLILAIALLMACSASEEVSGQNAQRNAAALQVASGQDCPSFTRLWNEPRWSRQIHNNIEHTVRVEASGAFTYDDGDSVTVSLQQLRDRLIQTRRETEANRFLVVLLEVAPQADCRQIARAAALIEETLPCRQGICPFRHIEQPPPLEDVPIQNAAR